MRLLLIQMRKIDNYLTKVTMSLAAVTMTQWNQVLLIADNTWLKSKNRGWNICTTEELFFIFQSFICFFGGSLCDFLHGFILNWKQKKPNEVDWFAKVIRINRLIFYNSWYLTQNGLYGCATGSKFLFN